MPIWTFARHGQSVANLEGWLAGHVDAPLTEQGRMEAIDARGNLGDPLPARAFCSDLARAHDTARLLLADVEVPLVVVPALRERTCGALERRSIADVQANPDTRARLASWTGRPPEGESLLDVALRAVGWITTVDDVEVDTVVVAHGALIAAVLAALDRRPRAEAWQWRPHNCEVIHRPVAVGAWNQVLDDLRSEAAADDELHER